MTTAETCSQLVTLAGKRRRLMATSKQLRQRQHGIARTACGFFNAASEADRASACKRGAALIDHVIDNAPTDDAVVLAAVDATKDDLIALGAALYPITATLKATEDEMVGLAEKLPVASFVQATPGLNFRGLSTLIGETGNLSNYPDHSKVWKRLGLAVIDGKAQQIRRGVEESQKQSFSPRRRRTVWMIGQSVLFKSSHYRGLYDARKKIEAQKPDAKSKMQIHLRAHRWLEKRFVRDLYNAWIASCGVAGDAAVVQLPTGPTANAALPATSTPNSTGPASYAERPAEKCPRESRGDRDRTSSAKRPDYQCPDSPTKPSGGEPNASPPPPPPHDADDSSTAERRREAGNTAG